MLQSENLVLVDTDNQIRWNKGLSTCQNQTNLIRSPRFFYLRCLVWISWSRTLFQWPELVLLLFHTSKHNEGWDDWWTAEFSFVTLWSSGWWYEYIMNMKNLLQWQMPFSRFSSIPISFGLQNENNHAHNSWLLF